MDTSPPRQRKRMGENAWELPPKSPTTAPSLPYTTTSLSVFPTNGANATIKGPTLHPNLVPTASADFQPGIVGDSLQASTSSTPPSRGQDLPYGPGPPLYRQLRHQPAPGSAAPAAMPTSSPVSSPRASWLASLQSASAAAFAQALGQPSAASPPLPPRPGPTRTPQAPPPPPSPSAGSEAASYNRTLSPAPSGPGAYHHPSTAFTQSPLSYKALGRVASPSASSSSNALIPYIPALPPPAVARPLPESAAAAARRPLSDRIHNATWAVARAFGFQAFNAREPQPSSASSSSSDAPPQQWVPSTAFLAADHLETLLLRNIVPRLLAAAQAAGGGGGGADDNEQSSQLREAAFARAVWELHSHIFLSYEGSSGWCRLVGLTSRSAAAEAEVLGVPGRSAGAPEVVSLLLLELCLYFLLYSEAANLRHTPELMWFLFWAAAHSPVMERLWRDSPLRPAELQLENARQRRIAMRNTMQAQLRAAQQHLDHDPAACHPKRCAETAAAFVIQLPSLLLVLGIRAASSASPASSDASLSCAASRALFADLACCGDGGFWTDVVVSPLFTVMAFEVDACASAGQEMAHRLGYDDINESLCRRDVVAPLLAALGVAAADAKAGNVHGALEALTRLGYPPAAVAADDASPSPAVPSDDPRAFDPVLAALFWSDRVLLKTHRERRSWSALLRAFYRVYSLQAVLLHAIMAHSFAPYSLPVLSSAVVTHAIIQALERIANWWLTRGARDPSQAAKARESWVTASAASLQRAASAGKGGGKKGDAEAEADDPESQDLATGPERSCLSDGGAVEARHERRRRAAVEGSPVWAVFGWLEWVLVAAGITGLFALQHIGPPALADMARSYWPLAAGGYTAAVVGHGLLAARDGYTVSLSAALRLPAAFRASSQRPRPECWVEGGLAVGWRASLLTALFWFQVLAAKVAFDYFVIMRPIAGQVRLILGRNWLGCPVSRPYYQLFGLVTLPLRCIDGDWLLVALRVAPFVIVCLVDTQIFYQLVLMVWGLVQGLQALNLGIAGSWEGLVAEFHRAPVRWWTRCMSTEGNEAARAAAGAAASRRLRALAGVAGGLPALGGGDLDNDEYDDGSDDSDSDYDSEFEYGSVYGDKKGAKHARSRSSSSFGSVGGHSSAFSKGRPPTPANALRRAKAHRRSPSPTASRDAACPSPSVDADAATKGGANVDVSPAGKDKKGKIKAAKKPKSGKARDAAAAAELVAMLSGQGEEQMAQWMAFAAAWDAVIDDLRSADLISDRERTNLVFTRLPAAATAMAVSSPASSAGSDPATPSAAAAAGASGTDSVSGESASSGASSSSSTGLSGRPLRPILLPAFFYAGQVQRAVDSGSPSPAQMLVLSELRSAVVWMCCQLRLVDGATAVVLLTAPCCPSPLDSAHGSAREAGMVALRRLVTAMVGLSEPLPPAGSGGVGEGLRRRNALAAEAEAALEGVLTSVEVEARAVVKARLGVNVKKAKAKQEADSNNESKADAGEPDPQVAAVALMDAVAALRAGLLQRPDRLAAALALLHPEGRGCGEVPLPGSPVASSTDGPSSSSASSASSDTSSTSVSLDLPLMRRVLGVVSKMLTLSAASAQPTGAEARRILSFFVTSLANRQMGRPDSVAASPSWTVLTPLYAEDVLFPLEAHAVAEALGLPLPAADASAGAFATSHHPSASAAVQVLPDLLTETEDRVSLMAYLRSMYAKDWDNFKERLGSELGGTDLSAATEADFAEGGPLEQHGLALQLWASYRGQLLARTVRGMAAYERALRVLAALEAPRVLGVGRRQHAAEVEDVVGGKFCHVVASQLYGRHRRSPHLRERWLAESTDVLLEANAHLRVSYLDARQQSSAAVKAKAPAQHFAVLIRGRRPGSEGRWEGFASQGGGRASSRTEELYRVRLPDNRFTGRGVILGEGKPENQNHAVIFCFGEALQTIDMNQDNVLAEALKMRNLLQELRPERDTRAAKKAEAALEAAVKSAAAAEAAVNSPSGSADAAAGASPEPASTALALTSPTALPAAIEFKTLLCGLRSAERPVAIVGFREWVFSDKAGALGTFAASSEFAFGTIVQRTMAYPAHVRLHYGHPDAFNKLFVMTRGGVAKATRQLHVSEDIFGGINHSLRGGRIKYKEFISCGKGRDMGFDSINAFESKISSGFGEVALSRDLLRMATRLDLWRCLHLYHSLAGNYFNTWLVMGSVYAHIYALLFFALAQAAVYRTVTYYPSPPPPPPGTPMVPPMPSPPVGGGVIRESMAYDTIRVEHVLQLGLLSLLPYIAEVALEQGLVKAVLAALAQVISGSFSFFIFKQQTTATALHASMLYGGASYIATGRGFSITSSSFIKLFANYGRSHIALGFELAALALALAATNDCARCSYGGLTWGTWLAALSLILAPCWFNPMAFSPKKVKRDMHAFAAWLRGEADRELGCTWAQWNRRQLAHSRDERGAQTDRWLNVLQGLLLRAAPPALLALVAASRLTLRLDKLPGLPAALQSPGALFLLTSAVLWALLAAAMSASRRFTALSDQRRWRLWSFWVSAGGLAAGAVFLIGMSQWFSGSGPANLGLLAYANVHLALAAHRALEHAAPRSSASARLLVDGGYMLLDSCVGWAVLAMLGMLSMLGVVGRVQTTLLFNVTFARSVRRGSLVKTIGTAKAGRGQGAALVGMVLEQGDNASVTADGGGGAGPSGGRNGRGKGKGGSRLQLQG